MTIGSPAAMWRNIGHVQAVHIVMLHEAGMIDDDAFAGITEAIERVGQTAPTELPVIAGAIRLFDERVDVTLPAGLRGTSRVGRGTIDVAAAIGRIVVREDLLAFAGHLSGLRDALIELASVHVVTLMPVSIDGQIAQPSTFGHLVASTVSAIARANTRLDAAYSVANRSPLGSGALASTGMPIDRERLTDLAGFDGLFENTVDAVSSVDHLTALADAIDAAVAPVRRLLEEVLAWVRIEPASFLFRQGWTTLQSDLPQVRPALEVMRLAGELRSVASRASALRSACGEVGFGPVSAELDRLVELAIDLLSTASMTVARATDLFANGVDVNRALLANRAGKGFSTSSDLADFLMIEEQIEPGAAQNIAALTISRAREQGLEAAGITVDLIDGAALLTIGREIKVEFEAISRYLAPRRFIERRTAPGGPAPATVRAHLDGERARLNNDRARWAAARDRLDRAAASLARALESTAG